MLTLYFTPGACSLAAHIVLEESGEKYATQVVDLVGGEQRTDAYLKLNPQGRVPVLRLDDGEPLTENTAILPYLGKRFGLWPSDPLGRRGRSPWSASSPRVYIRRMRISGARSDTPPIRPLTRPSPKSAARPFTAT
jgi:glutathione S-transferase